MKCIIGLGNPGSRYENTRHNIGFKAIESFVENNPHLNISEEKFRKGTLYRGILNSIPFLLCKPDTFMNLSGDATKEIRRNYKVDCEDILVIYDDMDFDFGQIKLKPKGSAGGHNGISDIIAKCGTNEIKRVRMGITRPAKGADVKNYVLEKFHKTELEKMNSLTDITDQVIESFIEEELFERVMSKYNNKKVDLE